jgi:hypothetical protein
MTLRNIPQQPFNVEVKEYRPRSWATPCPTRPKWVKDLLADGRDLYLEPIMIQAGRHFADSLNMSVFPGSATRRQEATKLAWTLVSMLYPTVISDKLVVTEPGDQDIRRLASEVLGVGGALELLRNVGLIDARTIRKVSSRFDFAANATSTGGTVSRVSIEAKGTMELASVVKQRKSFVGKLRSLGGLRGYTRAVGVVFSTWTDPTQRRHDIELMDPEGHETFHPNEAVREIIRFYARRFDETAGIPQAAQRLWQLAELEGLFNTNVSLREQLGAPQQTERTFNRSSFIFHFGAATQTYWGTFWEGSAIPCPLRLSDAERTSGLRYAYTGIDRRVIDLLRERRFAELLALRTEARQFTISDPRGLRGRFLADQDGVVRGWLNQIPTEIEYGAE